MMADYKLAPCARRFGVFWRRNKSTNTAQTKIIGFRCGKSACPYCRELRRKRLIRRLHLADWPETVYLWTITTDPKEIDKEEALKTLNKRWHLVHRNLKRLSPGIRYFRVIELTKSGLPHMHIIFDRYLPWHEFQSYLVQHQFGKVLHFARIPQKVLFGYVTKYIAKTLGDLPELPYKLFRVWSASVGFLPSIEYVDPDGKYKIVTVHKGLWRAEQMRHYTDIYLLDNDHM